ncbi:MAG TPA: pilus assembly protein TadG-related protein [Gaiellaceae bacterium]|jgi:Flp pilus assembly protein TadG
MSGRGFITRARGQNGQVIPLVAVMIVVLLGFAGLAIDVGNAWLQKRRLQSAVDLALLSAAQKLPNTSLAASDATTYTQSNWTKVSSTTVTATATTGCQVSGCSQPDKVSLVARSTVPTYFVRLFGINSWTVQASGAACGPCDVSNEIFDVVVVLDRSYSMCLDSDGDNNNCADMNNAVDGIKSLLSFFDKDNDRLGFVLLGSGDSKSPFSHAGSSYPCDTANTGDVSVSGKGKFYRTVGDFMDGTPSDHDSWLVAPLNNDFKNADGSLNNSSAFVSTLNCVKHKYWTPIAPAIDAARQELVTNGRQDSTKVIVFMGDGGGNVQPMRRDSNGFPLSQQSWYTPTTGNNLMPCHDAVAQAQRAKNQGIEIFTIGYDLNASGANTCYKNNKPSTSSEVEPGIDARSTIQQMATPDATPQSKHFYEKATPGEVYSIFNAIGRQITTGSVRLVE